jgi:hypothetical protein
VRADEILSEYLDGELAPEQRARVEKWLAGDARARKLLDELRMVGGALRALPRRNLGADLSRDVVEAAQRRILPLQPARRASRQVLRRRAVVGLSAAAAAVAVLVIAELRSPPPVPGGGADRQVARGGRQAVGDGAKGGGGEAATPGQGAVGSSRPAVASPPPLIVRDGSQRKQKTPLASVVRSSAPLTLASAAPPAAADGVLVVHLDVTRETLRNKLLDKLLDGNGIAWRSEHEQTRPAGSTEIVSVYVEALPAQLAGVLAALSAQPQIFRCLDVSPTLGQPAQEIVAEYARRIDTPPPESSPMAARPATGPSRPVPPADTAARQRVLFVVHVLDASGE